MELIISQEGKSIEEKKTVCMRNTVFAGVWMCVHKLLFMTWCLMCVCVYAGSIVAMSLCVQYVLWMAQFMDGPVV